MIGWRTPSLRMLPTKPSAGKIVITSGRVLEATPWAEKVPQTIVLRKADAERYLATCDVWRPRSSPLKPGSDVRLRGLVIAAGIFVSGAGTERNRWRWSAPGRGCSALAAGQPDLLSRAAHESRRTE